MNVTGPLQVPSQPTTPGFELSLRVNQRVTAEIVQVSGTQAVISVEGIPVVARLASVQQGVELSNQRRAQFIVTDVSGQSITLKLAGQSQAEGQVVGQVIPARDVAARLLEQNGLPINAETLTLVRAAISQRLIITPELLQELQAALSGMDQWNSQQAELAAALKAAGLPVSAASSQVAIELMTPLSSAIANLIDKLQAALNSANTPEQVKTLLADMLKTLQSASPDWNGLPDHLQEQLRQTVSLFGRSFESGLLGQDGLAARQALTDNPLFGLVRLQHQLEQSGQKELADAVGRFLEQAHAAQFLNVRPDPTPGSGAWTQLSFLLRGPDQQDRQSLFPAKLRIARRSHGRKGGIDPNYTHLSVQVEVEPHQVVQVDLSVAGKQLARRGDHPRSGLGSDRPK